MTSPAIVYTRTDEAPALATYALLPIIKAFTNSVDIDIKVSDISLANRVLAAFPDYLTDEQKVENHLDKLGQLVKKAQANIIKLPNISASVPQLKAVIKELQSKGYTIPNYLENATTDAEIAIKSRYSKVIGSAVNPVLREGNSDRRVADVVKLHAQNNPHRMGEWSTDSKTHVASMSDGDFYSSEQSVRLAEKDEVSIQFTDNEGIVTLLKESIPLLAGEIIDSSVMNTEALSRFFETSMQEAKADNVLLSLHLKATMMKASDPVIFGHAVKVYFKDVFEKHADIFAQLGVNPNNGIGDMYARIKTLDKTKQEEIQADIDAVYQSRPKLAMVNSDKGITNLHVPSDVIVDASMPAAIRSSGKMWGPDGKLKDTKALIPDRNYAGVYQATIEFCQKHGAFDVATMGSVANVGLMAQKAEEYGSHDKTFQVSADGIIKVIDASGQGLMEHRVNQGDIWRMCQTKEEPIKAWVELAVSRAKATGSPAIFWLDPKRAHDVHLIQRVKAHLDVLDTQGLNIQIMSPVEATHYTLERIKSGKNTISVTGNVLRDYLTDLFPILELGTSSKMLSIVPLLAGGGLFETGAGGTAPKHIQQLLTENHLRWDSLGEYLALAVSLEALAHSTGDNKIQVLADTLHTANGQYLANNKSPLRQEGEIDNRGSSFYWALYWSQALASQTVNVELKAYFTELAKRLTDNEDTIINELTSVQGKPVDLGGYFKFDEDKVRHIMQPSTTFNNLLKTMTLA